MLRGSSTPISLGVGLFHSLLTRSRPASRGDLFFGGGVTQNGGKPSPRPGGGFFFDKPPRRHVLAGGFERPGLATHAFAARRGSRQSPQAGGGLLRCH